MHSGSYVALCRVVGCCATPYGGATACALRSNWIYDAYTVMLPRPEKGGPKNGPKKGPSKNRLLEAFGSGRGRSRRSVRMASGLEIDEIDFLFGTPRTPEGAADSIAPRTPPGKRDFKKM